MKSGKLSIYRLIARVAPFTGAWIEIMAISFISLLCIVAPFTGAWIEMRTASTRCGWKSSVAPFTGAWIEIRA